jgi:Cu(I)/Ag(I) efflux system membrane protein CusA/SilA
MLATGIKSPVGVKVAGPDLASIEAAARRVEAVARTVPGVSSALADRPAGGRYLEIDVDRIAAARYGLNLADVHTVVSGLIGGDTVGEVVDGRARFPIQIRYPRDWRNTPQRLRELPIVTPGGGQITLGTVAAVRLTDGPPMLRSEDARLAAWVYVDVRGRDLSATVRDLKAAIDREMALTPGVSLAYAGQFEFLERATARLLLVAPATLLIIFVLLYLTFRRLDEAALILITVPFALSGGLWLLYLLDYNLSVATGVGFIALAGVAAEFGVIMLLYLRQSWARRQEAGQRSAADLLEAIREGALLRLRPKLMTVAVVVVGLLPILLGDGTGSEIMRRIAAPMVGGMVTAPLLSLLVLPAAYRLLRRREAAGELDREAHPR